MKQCIKDLTMNSLQVRVGQLFADNHELVTRYPTYFGPLTAESDTTFKSSNGPVLTDTTNGHTYRVASTNGTIVLTQVT